MEKIAFFDSKPYDKVWFDKLNNKYELIYFENKLSKATVPLAYSCRAVCAFVNDKIDKETINQLYNIGVELIVLRCAGFSNVDFKEAYGKIKVVRVPSYSPNAIAEHAFALLLSINRKIHKAYNRTRDFNFNISGLTGIDLYGKTAGVIGTGKIGKAFINICKGFGMNVVAYDLYPDKNLNVEYLSLDNLLKKSDIISLHCPLTEATNHILDENAFNKMKEGVFIINTSRGALIDSKALLNALDKGKIRGAGLDVYEEESEIFFEDFSGTIIKDKILSLLVSYPNVIITSHQAFLTEEALKNIAQTTLSNLDEFFSNKPLTNEICYHFDDKK